MFEPGGRLAQFDTPARVLGGPADEFVAEFVGADRGLRRLAVTPIDEIDLERPPVVHETDSLAEAHAAMLAQDARWAVVLDDHDNLRGWVSLERSSGPGLVSDRAERMDAWVTKDASLKDALATMLQWDAGWVAVLDGDRFLGVLTPGTLHEALRRSVSAEEEGARSRRRRGRHHRPPPLTPPATRPYGFVRLGTAQNPRARSDESPPNGFVRPATPQNPRATPDESPPNGFVRPSTAQNPRA